MSETLAVFKGQLDRQQKEIEDLRAENAKRRTTNKELKAQVATLISERDAAAVKVTDLEGKVGKAPTEAQTRIDELTSEVRGLKHKAVFRDKASEAGVDPKAIDVLWRESGYEADADDVNEEAMTEAITQAKQSHPFLFRPDAPATLPPTPPVKPPQGSDRGKAPGAATFKVTVAQNADPEWCMNNNTAMDAARKSGTLVIVP